VKQRQVGQRSGNLLAQVEAVVRPSLCEAHVENIDGSTSTFTDPLAGAVPHPLAAIELQSLPQSSGLKPSHFES
jgi:hypothetical protein